MNAHPTPRRPDIDWLRVFATYLLFPFHAAMVFNPAPFYHVRNGELSEGMLIFAGFISLWHMPLFFALAGWAVVASLRTRGSTGFAHERLLRLGVPLLVGCVFLMPPIKYLELASGLDLNHRGLFVSAELQEGFRSVIPDGLPVAPPFHESFFAFLPTFYTQLHRFTWAHLWFLAYLLTFTLLYRPLFLRLVSRPDAPVRVTRAWVYGPMLVLIAVQLILRPYWPGIQNLYDDWANVACYSVFLLCGAVVGSSPSVEWMVEEERWRALGVALAAMLILLLGVLQLIPGQAVLLAGSAIAGWCFVVALFGFARRLRLPDGPVLSYLSESALPVYVLHQLAIVAIGYRLVQLPLGIAAKFTLLVGLALAATLLVYHVLVRPIPLLRFAFGMRPRVCPLGAPVRPSIAAAALLAAISITMPEVASAASPIGRWYAEGGAAQVEIESCGSGLCGRVVWLRSPFDENGCALRDRWNPDPAARARDLIGLEIVRDLQPVPGDDGSWTGGTIYDPTSGRIYRAALTLDGEDRIQVRGYVGVPLLGRTTTWFRVGAEQALCRQIGG